MGIVFHFVKDSQLRGSMPGKISCPRQKMGGNRRRQDQEQYPDHCTQNDRAILTNNCNTDENKASSDNPRF